MREPRICCRIGVGCGGPMEKSAPTWIVQGKFGRATVNLIDRALVEHMHREFNFLFKLGGADALFRSNDVDLRLNDNSILLFNPGVPHAKLANVGEPTMILSLIIEPAWLLRVLSPPAVKIHQLFPSIRAEISPEVMLHASRLAVIISSRGTLDAAGCEDFVADLADAVTREYADPSLSRDIVANARPIDYRIRKALAYIHEHATENPMVDDVARRVGLSRSRFFEQFRRCVGTSPQHYLDCSRVMIATRLLSTTNRPLIELADELGYGNHGNFTRFFTQHVGVSPSEFRRQTISTIEDSPKRVSSAATI
jgi:AraC family transcriptional regulator